ncbi:hypothetical protein [Streptomyces sp. NPDC048737]|uniref:hypothetical protein n=1 Tax=Streptomyces sp. NPDC048737 TaxID=3155764 RepID=UPI00342F5258
MPFRLGLLLEQGAIGVRLVLSQDPQPHTSALGEHCWLHLEVQVGDDREGIVVRQPAGLPGFGLRRLVGVLRLRGINAVNGGPVGSLRR